jgi:hypothetical protein
MLKMVLTSLPPVDIFPLFHSREGKIGENQILRRVISGIFSMSKNEQKLTSRCPRSSAEDLQRRRTIGTLVFRFPNSTWLIRFQNVRGSLPRESRA